MTCCNKSAAGRPLVATQGATCGRAAGALGNTTESRTPHRRPDTYALQELTWELLPDRKRLTACCRILGRGVDRVTIQKRHGASGTRLALTGLAVCGSTWTCPHCSPRIAQGRADEISSALRQHREAGGHAVFVTLTHPHTRDDELSEQVQGICKARRRLRSGKWYQKLKKRMGLTGYISALEVTHSERNGWHPHCHEIWLLDGDMTAQEIKDAIYPKWRAYCKKEGLGTPSEKHGVDVKAVDLTDPDAISRYPVFGADLDRAARELTSSHTKSGKRSDSRTPWDLLIQAYGGDQRARWLWREFAETFKGRSSLFWSKGLKAQFGIGEESDEALAEADASIDETDETAAVIDRPDWQQVTQHKAIDGLLQLVDVFGQAGADMMISLCRARSNRRTRNQFKERFGHLYTYHMADSNSQAQTTQQAQRMAYPTTRAA